VSTYHWILGLLIDWTKTGQWCIFGLKDRLLKFYQYELDRLSEPEGFPAITCDTQHIYKSIPYDSELIEPRPLRNQK
jgi:hypothetical protein